MDMEFLISLFEENLCSSSFIDNMAEIKNQCQQLEVVAESGGMKREEHPFINLHGKAKSIQVVEDKSIISLVATTSQRCFVEFQKDEDFMRSKLESTKRHLHQSYQMEDKKRRLIKVLDTKHLPKHVQVHTQLCYSSFIHMAKIKNQCRKQEVVAESGGTKRKDYPFKPSKACESGNIKPEILSRIQKDEDFLRSKLESTKRRLHESYQVEHKKRRLIKVLHSKDLPNQVPQGNDRDYKIRY